MRAEASAAVDAARAAAAEAAASAAAGAATTMMGGLAGGEGGASAAAAGAPPSDAALARAFDPVDEDDDDEKSEEQKQNKRRAAALSSGLAARTLESLCLRRALAAHGATVFVAARNQEKAQHTVDALLKLLPDAQLRPFAVDLSSLKDIQRAANAFIATGSPLHLLINNAGAPAPSATRRPA